jgi:hypothetical protein
MLMLAVGAGPLCAQLTIDQKLSDFQQLAATYAKNYAPYEWKIEVERFDLFDLRPWLDRVRRTKDDIEFLEVCFEYVGSLNDGHAQLTIPSDFLAFLGFAVDIYDGKLLVDFIDRRSLPLARFPIREADELISVDGITGEQWLQRLRLFNAAGNERSSRRFAAQMITLRPQAYYPSAHRVGETATVVIQGQSGARETLEIPWIKTGTAMEAAGRVPSFRTSAAQPKASESGEGSLLGPDLEEVPGRLSLLRDLQTWRFRRLPENMVLNFGSVAPIYRLPANLQLRLGRTPADFFVSGTYTSGGVRIGYIRIPNYFPFSPVLALQQFATEVAFFEANTDGLVIDNMRNPGGNACYLNELVRLLMPYQYRTLGLEFRATARLVAAFSAELEEARLLNAPQWVIDLLRSQLAAISSAYKENRGRTGPLPICNFSLDEPPARDRNGRVIAYTKPIVVLADDMSASGGDAFPAILQDNDRAIILGIRTMGLGGAVLEFDAGSFSEMSTGVTIALMNRKNPVATSEYPTAPYVENIGVRPHVYYDYMIRENLLDRGTAFVNFFTQAVIDAVRGR